MKRRLKRVLGSCYTPRLRHAKRRLEVRFLRKGEPELALLPKLLARDQVAIDIGANIGDYLNVLALHSRRAIAFEPHPGCFAYLRAARIANATLLNLALSDRAGRAVLKVPVGDGEITGLATIEARNGSFAGLATRVQDYEVDVARLDDAVRDHLRAGERVGFVKIDVEGHEHAVLSGALATLDAHRPLVMVETEFRHGAPIPAIFDLFAARDYVAKVLLNGRMTDTDAGHLEALQQDVPLAEVMRDAQASPYVNNVWFFPAERLAGLARLGVAP